MGNIFGIFEKTSDCYIKRHSLLKYFVLSLTTIYKKESQNVFKALFSTNVYIVAIKVQFDCQFLTLVFIHF